MMGPGITTQDCSKRPDLANMQSALAEAFMKLNDDGNLSETTDLRTD